MSISEKEVIEELQIKNLLLIQNKDGFKFGTDAVLLSDFAAEVKSDRTLDLCTGSGVIPILMQAKTDTPEFHASEIQTEVAKMAMRSVELNGLGEKVHIHNMDLKDSVEYFGKRQFQLITCNPPYMKAGNGVLNQADTKILARHEISCTLEDIIRISALLLTHKGHLCMVHRPSRLTDLISLMRKYEIEPKRIRFVHNTVNHPPTLVLADGIYKGKNDTEVMSPLILYDEKGNQTEELKKIYGIAD